MGIGEKTGYKHVLFLTSMFSKGIFYRVVKSWHDEVKGLQFHYSSPEDYSYYLLNSLRYGKTLDCFKFKALADDNLN